MLPFKPFPIPSRPPPSQTYSHTHTYTHAAAKGAFVPLFWRTRFPSHFISDWQIPWADLWCFRHSTFFLHVQFKCTIVKTTCDVSTAESQCSSDASPHPHPFPSQIQKCFLPLKNCIPIQHWSKAWLCSMMNAQFPVHKQNYGKWEAFLASKETRAAVSDLIFFF